MARQKHTVECVDHKSRNETCTCKQCEWHCTDWRKVVEAAREHARETGHEVVVYKRCEYTVKRKK